MAHNDKNYVSVWFWMLAMLVMAIPGIGMVMILIWAFVGENESRKNYFRALLAWFLIATVLWGTLFAAGLSPLIWKHVQMWLHPPR